MRTQHIPMPIDEFHALHRHYAWKYEYWDGTVHIRPRELAVVGALPLHNIPEPSSTPPAGLVLAPLANATPEALAQLYRAAFRDTPDLCDYVGEILEREIRRWLTQDIARAHPTSRILRPKRHPRSVAALLLVKKTASGFLLDTLAVRPRYQHQGVATYLLRYVIPQLLAEGATELLTTYHPANEPSVAWHTHQGFIPLPCLSLTKLKLHAARSNGEDTTVLQAEVERLEAQVEHEGYDSVEPILRLH
ncbi:GNAT family N-acetyltransferase [Armatimonas rosea]|uniref:GNAT superfamily N-acetyltransferase n=1 Tax=Armatimonas rosea TaxID=685828 RepID=A0A7W9W6U5_ARMRO|nr:GNAT family N-acetyltransferase [Armatimonas rosea]MBB6050430.1 GNAT superfamily N-acetyltransferase [Armatimonas rosea]